MIGTIINYFKTGPDRPLLDDPAKIRSLYRWKRWSVIITLVVGYGLSYTCRLGLSIAKGPMVEAGIFNVTQMGMIGAALLYVYAIGKCANGFLADRANIRKFMSIALLCSAVVNLIFGFATSSFACVLILWALNGWFQSIGSVPSVVCICQWYSNKERGTMYGMWAGAHNIGEGISFIGTSFLVGWLGWQWGFWGPGMVCAVMAVIMFCLLADRPQTYGLPHVADYRQDYSAGKPSTEPVGRLQLQVLKSPLVWILGMSSALMYVTRYALHSWGPLYLQVVKHYTIVESGMIIGANTAVGFCGAVSSGYVSDRFFQSRRNLPTLLYGLLLTSSLILLYMIPPGYLWLDMFAFGCFEFAIGGLIVFLAGLTAVDMMPKKAAGAVKGLIGLFSYFAAASQDWISGYLIDSGKEVVNGETVYHFDAAFQFWIGASILSLLLALTVWNAKAAE